MPANTHSHSWQANQPNQLVHTIKYANPHLPLAGLVAESTPGTPYKLYEGMVVTLTPDGTIQPFHVDYGLIPIGIVYKSNVTPTGEFLDFEESQKVTVTTYGLAEVRVSNESALTVGNPYKVVGTTSEGVAIVEPPAVGDWVSGILVKKDDKAFTGITVPPFKF